MGSIIRCPLLPSQGIQMNPMKGNFEAAKPVDVSPDPKPCPFCGKLAALDEHGFLAPSLTAPGQWEVGCVRSANKAGQYGCGFFAIRPTRDAALLAWNSRAVDVPLLYKTLPVRRTK